MSWFHVNGTHKKSGIFHPEQPCMESKMPQFLKNLAGPVGSANSPCLMIPASPLKFPAWRKFHKNLLPPRPEVRHILGAGTQQRFHLKWSSTNMVRHQYRKKWEKKANNMSKINWDHPIFLSKHVQPHNRFFNSWTLPRGFAEMTHNLHHYPFAVVSCSFMSLPAVVL